MPAAASYVLCLQHLLIASFSSVLGSISCGLYSNTLSGLEPGSNRFYRTVQGIVGCVMQVYVCTMSPKDTFLRISACCRDTCDWVPRSEIAESQGSSISNVLFEKMPCCFPGGCIGPTKVAHSLSLLHVLTNTPLLSS